VSSRRNASVGIALAVASLAVTSMGAMVASSELLVDAVDRPAGRRLDPLVLDLGSVGTVQAELPRDEPAGRPPSRRRPPAGDPPQRRREPAAPAAAGREDDEDDGLVVVAHVKVVKKIVVRKPVVQPPPPRPSLPRPSPPRPSPPDPHPDPRARRPRRRWAPHPDQHRHHRPCGDRPWRREHDGGHDGRDDRTEDRRERDDWPALSAPRPGARPAARARRRTRCPRGPA
jgi:hypothetical protein